MATPPFAAALAALASPHSTPETRADAERVVTAATEDPGVVLALAAALAAAEASPAERHLAAVLLSTAAGKHWRALDEDARSRVRRGVLAALASTESPAELRALAHAADVVAQASAGGWTELLPALADASSSAVDAHREASIVLLGNLVESMGAHLHEHHAALASRFARAASGDPCRRVRDAAVAACAQLATALTERGDFPLLASIAPSIVACLIDAARNQVAAKDDDALAAALNALASVTSSCSVDAIFGDDAALATPAAEIALAVAADATRRDGAARGPAFEVLSALAMKHGELIDRTDGAGAGAGSIAARILAFLVADAGSADARATLRQFALHLPPATVLPVVVAPLLAASDSGAVPTPGQLAALAAAAEGCACDVAEDDVMPRALDALSAGMTSGDARTMTAAAEAFAEMAEHAGHAMTSLHETRVGALFVDAIRRAVAAESASASEGGGGGGGGETEAEAFARAAHDAAASLCDNYSNEELAPFLEPLVSALVTGATNVGACAMARARCLASLACVARAAAFDFEPFAPGTLRALASLAGAEASGGAPVDSLKRLAVVEGAAAVRARALAAMATIVAAVGEDAAPAGAVDALLDAATKGVSDQGGDDASSTMRECSLRCFGRLAVVLEGRLSPWLPGATRAAANALVAARANASVGGGRHGRAAVTTGGVTEAQAAAETLGAFVNSCGASVVPLMPSILSALASAVEPTNAAALRTAAARAFEFSLHPFDAEDPEAGPTRETVAAAMPFARDALALLSRVVTEEEEPEVALAAATSLETVIERVKRLAAVSPEAAAAATDAATGARAAAQAVLDGATACQAELEEGGGGGHEGGDGEDTGTVFMDLEDEARRIVKLCEK